MCHMLAVVSHVVSQQQERTQQSTCEAALASVPVECAVAVSGIAGLLEVVLQHFQKRHLQHFWKWHCSASGSGIVGCFWKCHCGASGKLHCSASRKWHCALWVLLEGGIVASRKKTFAYVAEMKKTFAYVATSLA